ncbi:MAG: SRPBCC domain-containing protein [Phycisphaerae bacterium]|nr:SRPBCC domain-containing protein [Phycisphaerae bacterium]
MSMSVGGESLELCVQIAARPEVVFRFLSDATGFAAWMGDGAMIEPVVGGAVRVKYPHGPVAVGRVLELTPPRRAVYSWGYESGPSAVKPESSTLTITLTGNEEGTLVTLRHDGLPSEAERIGHTAGWRHYLAMMSTAAHRDAMADRLDSVVDAYVSAWAEPDAARRLTILQRCWAEDGRFRDAFGCVDGREALTAHIGNAIRMTGGARLERAGAIQQVHSFGRFAWRAVRPDGTVLASGVNCVEFNAAGQIAAMVGFWDSPSME